MDRYNKVDRLVGARVVKAMERASNCYKSSKMPYRRSQNGTK